MNAPLLKSRYFDIKELYELFFKDTDMFKNHMSLSSAFSLAMKKDKDGKMVNVNYIKREKIGWKYKYSQYDIYEYFENQEKKHLLTLGAKQIIIDFLCLFKKDEVDIIERRLSKILSVQKDVLTNLDFEYEVAKRILARFCLYLTFLDDKTMNKIKNKVYRVYGIKNAKLKKQ